MVEHCQDSKLSTSIVNSKYTTKSVFAKRVFDPECLVVCSFSSAVLLLDLQWIMERYKRFLSVRTKQRSKSVVMTSFWPNCIIKVKLNRFYDIQVISAATNDDLLRDESTFQLDSALTCSHLSRTVITESDKRKISLRFGIALQGAKCT